ncbi:MAG: methylmalonyl-CoA epimerase [Acidimicrobiia bacterium]|nr:methylmalonyl-CoA epimerase [Acidimicrobiia bacterium]
MRLVVMGATRYAPDVLPYNIHHVAIAVEDLDAALDGFRTLYNVEPLSREIVADQAVEEAMIAVGGSHIQILQATEADSPVGRFVERNGEGLHHIAFAVVDIDAALEHLRAEGARLIDEKPRTGGGGHKIAFVHPKETAGTLIELVEVGHE